MSSKKVDKHRAPKGYIAIAANGCKGCHFYSQGTVLGCKLSTTQLSATSCIGVRRPDNINVIFKAPVVARAKPKANESAKKVDKNNAPPGYIAVANGGCTDCAFNDILNECTVPAQYPCCSLLRPDRQSVSFVKVAIAGRVDKYEAPEGYTAVAEKSKNSCVGCAFLAKTCPRPDLMSCHADARNDRRSVIFVPMAKRTVRRKKPEKKAKLESAEPVIRIRAWSEELQRMYYDSEIGAYTGPGTTLDRLLSNPHLKYMMGTGFKDSKGQVIYEGDIIRVASAPITGAVFQLLMADGKTSSWLLKDSSGAVHSLPWPSKDTSVVGNIYQNPGWRL